MSETPQTQPEPNNEEIQETLERAESLLAEVKHYRSEAQEIDDRFTRKNEDRRLSLDDMPYGEELIRTRELPTSIEMAIALLTKIETGKVSSTDAIQAFQKAEEIIQDARDTIDDCTSLPSKKDEEDE